MGKPSPNLGVIFDCDGTLLDSMQMWHDVDYVIAERAGIHITQADRDFFTRATLYESSVYFHEKFGYLDSPDAVMHEIFEYMRNYYEHDARPKTGALEFVRGLHELGIPMGIASSTSSPLLRIGVRNAGFEPYMKAVFSVEDLETSKREPIIYDAVREALGTPLASTWGVEDAVYALETLRNAGYRTLAVYDSEIAGSPRALEEASDRFIMSFEDIAATEFVRVAEGFSGQVQNGELQGRHQEY